MGNNTKNSIEINGKWYDAITGKLLNDSAAAPQTALPKQSDKYVDGFRRVSRDASSQAAQPLRAKPARPTAKKAHTPASHIAPHKPQPAVTLMRNAVKKPNLAGPAKIKAVPRTDSLLPSPKYPIVPKMSHGSIDPVRAKRADRVIQSPAVSRYSKTSAVDSLAASASLRLATVQQPASSTPAGTANGGPGKLTERPDIFQQAIRGGANANAGPASAKARKKRSPLAVVATASMAVLLFIAVFAYFNAPALSLKLASSRAGFEARLPNYSPSGFRFGNIHYGPGNVTVSYKAGDKTQQGFVITQRTSTWDSQSLLGNFVNGTASAYQTYEKAGRTIYILGETKATWVDSGVWYLIDGSNNLSKAQMLDLASSL